MPFLTLKKWKIVAAKVKINEHTKYIFQVGKATQNAYHIQKRELTYINYSDVPQSTPSMDKLPDNEGVMIYYYMLIR